jgi:hypothetical protein
MLSRRKGLAVMFDAAVVLRRQGSASVHICCLNEVRRGDGRGLLRACSRSLFLRSPLLVDTQVVSRCLGERSVFVFCFPYCHSGKVNGEISIDGEPTWLRWDVGVL